MRMSAASASAKPPPAAAPCTSAMIGCGHRRMQHDDVGDAALLVQRLGDPGRFLLAGAPRHRLLEIKACAKISAGASQHHDAGGAVALQTLEIDIERVDQGGIERIQTVGAIERDPIDPVMMFDQKRFCHAGLPFIVVPAKAGTHNHKPL